MSLIESLTEAEKRAAITTGGCRACAAIDRAAPDVQDALRRAMAGTIGIRRLVQILHEHHIPVGRDAITRHRKERHGQ